MTPPVAGRPAVRFDPARRADGPELMDVEPVGYEDFRACLADLATVNVLFLGHRPTLLFLERLRRAGRLPAGRLLTILDVGSGYGDGLRAMAAWAARRGVPVRITGLDLNPHATRAAREATPAGLPIDFVTADAFAPLEGPAPDLVTSSLFTHHLEEPDLVRFLRLMEERAALGWFVNDLARSAVSFHGFRAVSTLARWHRFVRHDGPLSIARAFRPADWARLIAAAGLDPASVRVRPVAPFRLCVERVK